MDQEKVDQRAKGKGQVSDLDIQNSLLGETAILQIEGPLFGRSSLSYFVSKLIPNIWGIVQQLFGV